MGKQYKTMLKYRLTIILLGLLGYSLTVAPTLSFWDCGEYIAAANVLGIPHPPGNPLFVMLGRVFILLFGWFKGEAFAVNLLSLISSVLCCLVIFEITFNILPKNLPNKMLYALSFFAASISLFGNTFWFNAMEASVYNVSMLVIMLQVFFTLKWRKTFKIKYLLLVLYLAFLGFGIHTFCLLALPAIFIFVLLVYLKQNEESKMSYNKSISNFNSKIKKINFSILFAVLLIFIGLSVQLYLPIRSSTKPILNENNPAQIENFLEVVNRKQYGDMNMFERAFYRRASVINQFTFSENIGYLGYHLNQFFPAPLGAQEIGKIANGFLETSQFFHRIVFEFLLVASIAGIIVYRKNLNVLFMGMMFLLSSVGLIFYLNLADGTRVDSSNAKNWNLQIKELRKSVPDSIPNLASLNELNSLLNFYFFLPNEMQEMWLKNAPKAENLRTVFAWKDALNKQGIKMANPPRLAHKEVRNRDYFFTPAFLFFAILLSIAFGIALTKIKSIKMQKTTVLILMFAWVVPFAGNFNSNNRSNDFTAHDFAMNVLKSIPQNGILITYGDNDTFPLWYMQMVEKYRKDVIIINENLSHSKWYKEQILEQHPYLLKNSNEKDFIGSVIASNYPNRSVNFTLGIEEEKYKKFSENLHIIGLVKRLGVDKQTADSLLTENLTKNYKYSLLDNSNQEANAQTRAIYRYLESL